MKYALLGLGAIVGFCLLFVGAIVVGKYLGKLLRGPSTVDREAAADAPEGCCLNAAKGWEHDPWCSRRPLPACARCGVIWCTTCATPAVVAGDDLAWQAALDMFHKDYAAFYRAELPGERAS